MPQCRRHLHRVHHAGISGQVPTLHGPAARIPALLGGGHDLRPGDPGAAPVHHELDEQGAELARRAGGSSSDRGPGPPGGGVDPPRPGRGLRPRRGAWRCRASRRRAAASEPGGQVPDPGGAGAGRGVHGLSRPRHRRGVREPAHRGGHGVHPVGVAGGPGPLVRPHPSRGPGVGGASRRPKCSSRASRCAPPTGC